MKRGKKPLEAIDDMLNVADLQGDTQESSPPSAPHVVAVKLLHLALDSVTHMMGAGEERQFATKTVYVASLKQATGQIAYAIELLEGKATLPIDKEVSP